MRPGETKPQLSIRFRIRISTFGQIEVTLLVLENKLSREKICFGLLYLDEKGLGSTVLLTGRKSLFKESADAVGIAPSARVVPVPDRKELAAPLNCCS
jgi:hypothetical protein